MNGEDQGDAQIYHGWDKSIDPAGRDLKWIEKLHGNFLGGTVGSGGSK